MLREPTTCIAKSVWKNVLTDESGEKVRLKPGAEVDVILEADTDAYNRET